MIWLVPALEMVIALLLAIPRWRLPALYASFTLDGHVHDLHRRYSAFQRLYTDGKYEFSFYLPDYQGRKMKSFRVFDHMLVALYDNYLYGFRLNF